MRLRLILCLLVALTMVGLYVTQARADAGGDAIVHVDPAFAGFEVDAAWGAGLPE